MKPSNDLNQPLNLSRLQFHRLFVTIPACTLRNHKIHYAILAGCPLAESVFSLGVDLCDYTPCADSAIEQRRRILIGCASRTDVGFVMRAGAMCS